VITGVDLGGRRVIPAEIAAAALCLASDEAAYTTGTVIVADAGLTIEEKK